MSSNLPDDVSPEQIDRAFASDAWLVGEDDEERRDEEQEFISLFKRVELQRANADMISLLSQFIDEHVSPYVEEVNKARTSKEFSAEERKRIRELSITLDFALNDLQNALLVLKAIDYMCGQRFFSEPPRLPLKFKAYREEHKSEFLDEDGQTSAPIVVRESWRWSNESFSDGR